MKSSLLYFGFAKTTPSFIMNYFITSLYLTTVFFLCYALCDDGLKDVEVSSENNATECYPDVVYEIPTMVYSVSVAIYTSLITYLPTNSDYYNYLNLCIFGLQIAGQLFYSLIAITAVKAWVALPVYFVPLITSLVTLSYKFRNGDCTDFTIYLNFGFIFWCSLWIVASYFLESLARTEKCTFTYRSGFNVFFSSLGIQVSAGVFIYQLIMRRREIQQDNQQLRQQLLQLQQQLQQQPRQLQQQQRVQQQQQPQLQQHPEHVVVTFLLWLKWSIFQLKVRQKVAKKIFR